MSKGFNNRFITEKMSKEERIAISELKVQWLKFLRDEAKMVSLMRCTRVVESVYMSKMNFSEIARLSKYKKVWETLKKIHERIRQQWKRLKNNKSFTVLIKLEKLDLHKMQKAFFVFVIEGKFQIDIDDIQLFIKTQAWLCK